MADIEFHDHSDIFLSAMKKAIRTGLEAIGLAAEGYAKKVITEEDRIDTGRMRNSVSHVVKDEAAYIGTNVEYAPYQELGTVNMRGIHFLKRAATEHKEEYKALMEDAMKNA